MASPPIEESLVLAESAVAARKGLGGTGFWATVERVKRDPELVDRYAGRIAAIDRKAFEEWVLFSVPVGVGTVLMAIATAAGVVLIGLSYEIGDDLMKVLAFLAGLVVLLVTTHGLAHLVVGRIFGIKFTHWFIGTLARPQPGVKIDYDSYLHTPAEHRAWMHASGAIVTKLVPFLLIGAAVAAGMPSWVIWALVGLGVITIITDIFWSTGRSDWKKYRREMQLVQDS